MFLKNLKIYSSGELVRDISFKRGLNLVLDESNPEKNTMSGNSVGKTTLLRVVDYCFGSDGIDIYQDEEFRDNLNDVMHFLTKNNVLAKLEIEKDAELFVLQRGFGTPEIAKINEEDYESPETYRKALEVKLFNIELSKPSLREVMPKFIRKNIESMSKAIRFGGSFTPGNKYEVIYAYLFDFPDPGIVRVRYESQAKLKIVENRLTALRDGKSLPYYKQALRLVDKEISQLEKRKDTYNISELYEERMKMLTEIREIMSRTSTKVGKFETQVQMHIQTISELNKKSSDVDPTTLRALYEEAGRYSEKLNKDFEELLHFHNAMVINKIKFVKEKLEVTQEALDGHKKKLEESASQESVLLGELAKEGALTDLETLYRDLSRVYERRGRAQQKVDEIQGKENEKNELLVSLKKLEENLKLATNTFEENINKFNEFFSDYSKRLYDQSFALFQKEPGSLSLQIDNMEGNVGSGKKKGAIAAFDLAYIDYVSTINSDKPRFVLHNGIEEIGNNQLKTLFEIANRADRQYVVALIRDRLDFMDAPFLKSNTILSLSEDDKFFRF